MYAFVISTRGCVCAHVRRYEMKWFSMRWEFTYNGKFEKKKKMRIRRGRPKSKPFAFYSEAGWDSENDIDEKFRFCFANWRINNVADGFFVSGRSRRVISPLMKNFRIVCRIVCRQFMDDISNKRGCFAKCNNYLRGHNFQNSKLRSLSRRNFENVSVVQQ